nr:MAG TPA: hypothetical protein [Caudoviricetes sp.]
MCNEYAYQVAKALIYPELAVEFATDVINGNVYGHDIWDEVCTLTGGWCNDANVFVAWDKMGRPDEWEYLPGDYDMERDPDRRRAMVANARISAMAEEVANALYDVVNETVVNDGWKCVPIEEWNGDIDDAAWLLEGCDVLDVYTESCLIKPNGK